VQTADSFSDDGGPLLRYRSARFDLSVPFPDGPAWKIDDHSTAALVARHPPTSSTLTVQAFGEPVVMNRQKCEASSREKGLVTLRDPQTIEDLRTTGPDAYDSRIWVALESRGSPEAPLFGHVFLFGAFVRKCLFLHFATSVASERDEDVLTTRLAVARLRIIGGVRVVAFDQPPRANEEP
jgi:hypothetical protein